MARRLPLYLVLDVSGSMIGEKLTAVENGVQTVKLALQGDPRALETVSVSVVTFCEECKQVSPLTDITQFVPPSLTVGGGTALGGVLSFVTDCAGREIRKNTAEVKGDYKPMVMFMTDGAPTDDISSGLAKFKAAKWGTIVACAVGADADTDVLRQITDNVVQIESVDSESIKAFFKWITQSVTSNSHSVGAGNGQLTAIEELPPPPPEITIL